MSTTTFDGLLGKRCWYEGDDGGQYPAELVGWEVGQAALNGPPPVFASLLKGDGKLTAAYMADLTFEVTPPKPAPRGDIAGAGGSDGLQPEASEDAEAFYKEVRRCIFADDRQSHHFRTWRDLSFLPLEAPTSELAGIAELMRAGWLGSEIADVLCLFGDIMHAGGEREE